MIERATVAVLCRPVRLLRKTFIAGTLLSTIVMIVATSAQSDYPTRPVQLIVPYGAGGIADVGMCILADQLTGRLKQQFVVENRLIRVQKFPVPLRREFGCKPLNSLGCQASKMLREPRICKFPCYIPC